jgi:hypothetical protein
MTHAVLDYEDIATRYRRIRKVGGELNKILTRYVSKEELETTARKLGLWQEGTLVFQDMGQTTVLFDQAIHGYFADGSNAVDRYLADHPPGLESDQEEVLTAKKRSFFSLFQVERIVPQVGVHVHDLLRDRRHFLADVGFSQTAVKGLVLATRALPFGNFLTTSGAPLPMDADTLANIFRMLALQRPWQDIEGMSKQEMADVTAAVIHLCLKASSSREISYQQPFETAHRDRTLEAGKSHVGRNDRCPCGSGSKYKKCCGR